MSVNQGNIEIDLTAVSYLRPLIGFAVAFLVPVIFLLFWLFGRSDQGIPDTAESDKNFPQALVIRSVNDHVRFKSATDLQPVNAKDFNLIIWFRLFRLPSEEARSFLVLKYDRNAPKRQGYGLALTADGKRVRPLVYWGSTEVAGQWFNFESFDFDSKSWNALVLSFIDGQSIGLHLVRPGEVGEQGITLLGGYRFEQPVYALSDSDLVVGGMSNGQLPRARIGAFAISHIEGLEEQLPDLLAGLAKYSSARAAIKEQVLSPALFIDNFRTPPQELVERIVHFPEARRGYR